MPTLLIVHHTVSPHLQAMFEATVNGASGWRDDPRAHHLVASTNVQAMFEAVVDGATADEIEGVNVVRKPALAATPSDVLAADGYLLGTTANLGYMSGALKHFFDQIYYPCLDATKGRPYSYYVHGGSDVAGTTRGIERIVTGLGWETSAAPVTVTGEPSKDDLEACWELGATLAASLME